jgi:phosphoglucosamine mutase
MLEDALISGLVACGSNVWSVGMIPTPALAYLTKTVNADVGLMLTASHNPPEYNGIKVFDGDSVSYGDQSQAVVEQLISGNKFSLTNWDGIGKALYDDLGYMYVKMIKDAATLKKPKYVIADPGCGATFSLAPEALKAIGCRVTALNAQPDGFFPARSSEPNEKSLKDLSKAVKELGAEAGVGFDGDGDRVAFVDEQGRFVDFDKALAAYSASAVRGKKGEFVVTTVEASMCIETMVEGEGGKVVRTKVGDIYVSEAVKRLNAVFGGEPCGAWVHPKFHLCPDGPLSAALLLKTLENEKKSLSEFVADVPQYITLRENVCCENKIKEKVLGRIKKDVTATFPEYKSLTSVDGVRLSLEDGWILIRPSGTEPLIRVTVEGESLKTARNILAKGKEMVLSLTSEK